MDQLTDFEVELDRIDKAIADIPDPLACPMDGERATKFVYLVYQRASLTGNFRELEDAEAALNTAIQHLGPAGDLYFLKANIDFKFHAICSFPCGRGRVGARRSIGPEQSTRKRIWSCCRNNRLAHVTYSCAPG